MWQPYSAVYGTTPVTFYTAAGRRLVIPATHLARIAEVVPGRFTLTTYRDRLGNLLRREAIHNTASQGVQVVAWANIPQVLDLCNVTMTPEAAAWLKAIGTLIAFERHDDGNAHAIIREFAEAGARCVLFGVGKIAVEAVGPAGYDCEAVRHLKTKYKSARPAIAAFLHLHAAPEPEVYPDQVPGQLALPGVEAAVAAPAMVVPAGVVTDDVLGVLRKLVQAQAELVRAVELLAAQVNEQRDDRLMIVRRPGNSQHVVRIPELVG